MIVLTLLSAGRLLQLYRQEGGNKARDPVHAASGSSSAPLGLNTFVIHDKVPAVFELASATYNVSRKKHGYELTFACDTREPDHTQYHPKLEVTIVCDTEPEVRAGKSWERQPGYIDRENLWNVTNFYEWCHENFEDFTVSVAEDRGDSLLCRITGHITLNRHELQATPVTVTGLFRRDPGTFRSVK